jgi:response regulator RpfG family c-di-GMP phosphodiesterase
MDAEVKDAKAGAIPAFPSLVTAARRATILLVDDEDVVRASTAEMLEDLGYTVVEASSGAEALRYLRGPSITSDATGQKKAPPRQGSYSLVGRTINDIRPCRTAIPKCSCRSPGRRRFCTGILTINFKVNKA